MGEQSLLVLTSADVECWSVSVEKGGEDRLLWSFPMWGAVQHRMFKGRSQYVFILRLGLICLNKDFRDIKAEASQTLCPVTQRAGRPQWQIHLLLGRSATFRFYVGSGCDGVGTKWSAPVPFVSTSHDHSHSFVEADGIP
jgi:hypothetical protein